jgi:hypothetical protein
MYGKVEYDKEGKPICEICGKSFHRVLSHVRQKHDMSEQEYKKKFGLDLLKGICSEKSSSIAREKVYENYDKCISKNLIKGGQKSRFKKGSDGRTQPMVSEQTRLMLVDRAKNNLTPESRKKIGRELGLSGLGNKARWRK